MDRTGERSLARPRTRRISLPPSAVASFLAFPGPGRTARSSVGLTDELQGHGALDAARRDPAPKRSGHARAGRIRHAGGRQRLTRVRAEAADVRVVVHAHLGARIARESSVPARPARGAPRCAVARPECIGPRGRIPLLPRGDRRARRRTGGTGQKQREREEGEKKAHGGCQRTGRARWTNGPGDCSRS